ncbi:MAG: UDP-N-acetylmuramoyl-L-alanyl-D-glutamate--2,6-diaminopimelate ligase [Chlamydiia bacterium]|nr:UDP-N-acetylmuramoyl-L-alanyl-D-glutamate--2,6-diaminopimelate ligase [Chlamydiia bacterium]
MKLKKLLKDLDVTIKGSKEVEVTGISSHSQFVSPGSLFVAKKGKTFDGHEFISKAIETGAVAIVTDCYNPFLQGVTQIITTDADRLEALLAKRYYSAKSHSLYLIGITGTNGKTTTAYLIQHLLPTFGLMGTIETIIGKDRFPAQLTTSDVVTNHKTLYEMGEKGLKGAVMEVTSHALDQNRVEEIPFDLGIFTNFSQDHLDYHKTMESYLAAKLKLFAKCKEKIYNLDDPALNALSGGMTFGLHSEADLVAKNIATTLSGTTFDLHYQNKCVLVKSPLIGDYNVYNVLAAFAAALKKGEKLHTLIKRLETFPGIPGRLERIDNALGIHLFVDFAHTPEALEKVLATLHHLKTGKIITVFGCGGERDQDKRPQMGKAVEKYSDTLIITSDNPRSEEPIEICNAIKQGVAGPALIEVDRRAAIERALFMAKENDLVLIAGRGHESHQKIKGRQIPFDDRVVAQELSQLTEARKNG